MSLITQAFTGLKLEPFERPQEAVTESVPFIASQTVAKGTIVGIVSASGKWGVYDDDDETGLQVARGIAQYDFTTDGDGNVTIANETGVEYHTAPVYLAGTFRTTELTGLDAAALADLGRLVGGTLADGVLRIG